MESLPLWRQTQQRLFLQSSGSATHLQGLQGHRGAQPHCVELRGAPLEETTPHGRVDTAPTAATSMNRCMQMVSTANRCMQMVSTASQEQPSPCDRGSLHKALCSILDILYRMILLL
jgi:hypothetical protein